VGEGVNFLDMPRMPSIKLGIGLIGIGKPEKGSFVLCGFNALMLPVETMD
jgi:hypothetical protein